MTKNVIDNLKNFSKATINDVKQMADGLFETAQNALHSMSTPLLGQAQFLGSDNQEGKYFLFFW
jgi:hypothetical protein